jgi:hypothetical protein
MWTRSVVGGATSSLLTDVLGSTIALADGTGAVQTSYTCEPFGDVTSSGATNTNSHQFTGRENDATTGLLPGSLLQPDVRTVRLRGYAPIPRGPDPNLYAHVANARRYWRIPFGLVARKRRRALWTGMHCVWVRESMDRRLGTGQSEGTSIWEALVETGLVLCCVAGAASLGSIGLVIGFGGAILFG